MQSSLCGVPVSGNFDFMKHGEIFITIIIKMFAIICNGRLSFQFFESFLLLIMCFNFNLWYYLPMTCDKLTLPAITGWDGKSNRAPSSQDKY